MRSIPARVIWLLGMDDGAFPRKPQPEPFDLIARRWKLGDRSVREDDRYVFLEALLSARDRLCISYLGRSHLNNQAAPPSVVVSELLDYIEQRAALPGGVNLGEPLIVEHRLQAFSSRYYTPGSPLFSYSQANAAASCQGAARREAPFMGAPLPEPALEERTVRIEWLVEFFANPAAFFLRRRLGLRLEERDRPLEESEPMEIDSLAAYQIRQELFEPRLKESRAPGRDAFTARALLPPGSMGEQYFEKADRATGAFHGTVRPLLVNPEEPTPIELRLGEFTLTGVLESIYNGRPVLFRPATLKPKDRLRAWIKSLLWCAAAEAAGRVPLRAVLAGEDEVVEFAAPDSTQLLERLLEIYWHGLREPVPFFPASSLQYAAVQQQPPSSKRSRNPLDAARLEWLGGFNKKAECEDPAYRLCFGGADPLNAEFEALSMEIAGALLTAQRELSGW
jgi:exodeoxyribonuclease V gamma subunit